jgi:DNA-directed RNA polymerase subunit omega
MDLLNQENNVDSEITSRYTIVVAAAKRAREVIDGAPPLTYAPTDKAVSIAVNELFAGKIKIKTIVDTDNAYEHHIATGTYESFPEGTDI